MSEFSEAVVAALTAEWRSTSEIAAQFPNPRKVYPITSHVYKILDTAERRGVAEKKVVDRRAYWRLRP